MEQCDTGLYISKNFHLPDFQITVFFNTDSVWFNENFQKSTCLTSSFTCPWAMGKWGMWSPVIASEGIWERFYKIWLLSKIYDPTITKFGECHNNSVVVICARYDSDWRFIKINFYKIWVRGSWTMSSKSPGYITTLHHVYRSLKIESFDPPSCKKWETEKRIIWSLCHAKMYK